MLDADQHLADARRKPTIWRHDYNAVRPPSALNGNTPADAHRAFEQVEGSAPCARANPSTMRRAEPELSIGEGAKELRSRVCRAPIGRPSGRALLRGVLRVRLGAGTGASVGRR